MATEQKFKQTEIGLIPEDWDIKPVSEVSEISLGGTPKTSIIKYWNGDVNWASAKDVSNCKSRYLCDTERTVTKEGIDNSAAKILPENTIVITSRGTVGELALLSEPMSFNQTCYGLKAKENMDSLFLYYNLKNSINRIKSISYGTVFSTITVRTFDEIKLAYPSLNEQHRIAKILSDLDSKIELLQKQNKTLEAIGQAIFKHWFVDFEFPCLPDGAGKPYDRVDLVKLCTYKAVGGIPSPQQDKYFIYVILCDDSSFYIGITDDIYRRWHEHCTGMGSEWTKSHIPVKIIHYEEYTSKNEAAKREKWLKTGFGRKWLKREYAKYLKSQAGSPAQMQVGSPAPKCKLRQAGEMVFNDELGKEIPKGWEVKPLDQIANFLNGLALQKFPPEGDDFLPVIKIKELRQGITVQSDKASPDIDKKYIINEGDVLFSWSGTLMVVIWGEGKGALNQHLFKVTSDDFEKWFYYYWIKNHLRKFIGIAKDKTTTMGHIKRHHLTDSKVLVPNDVILEKMNEIMNSFIHKIIKNELELRMLISLRDTLLPKLMSGEIRVNNLEAGTK
jgi:type I restriction enzyme S subunit